MADRVTSRTLSSMLANGLPKCTIDCNPFRFDAHITEGLITVANYRVLPTDLSQVIPCTISSMSYIPYSANMRRSRLGSSGESKLAGAVVGGLLLRLESSADCEELRRICFRRLARLASSTSASDTLGFC